MAATPQGGTKYPFLLGTQEQRVPIGSIPITPGLKGPTLRIPKNGYLLKMLYRLVPIVTVGTAHASGSKPSQLHNLLSSVVLSYNGGFQYRQVDGESLVVMNQARYFGQGDPVYGSPEFMDYNPNSATAQNAQLVIEDEIGLNIKTCADLYILAAQARNADIVLDVTFGAASSIVNNGEVITSVAGTLYIDGLYLLDPDYNSFNLPDLSKVQQFTTDTSFTNVSVGDNTVSVLPVNGPKYLQLFFKVQTNNTADVGGFASVVTRVQLKINNGLSRIDTSIQTIQQENARQLGRMQLTSGFYNTFQSNVTGTVSATSGPFLPGWYMLDFLDDIDANNSVSRLGTELMQGAPIGRNVLSTEKIANLWLIVTIATGTTVTNSLIKLIKRVEMPAVA